MRKIAILFLLVLTILAISGNAIAQESSARRLGRETARLQIIQRAFGDMRQGEYNSGIRKAQEDIMNNVPLGCKNCSDLENASYWQELARRAEEHYNDRRGGYFWEGVAEAYGSRRREFSGGKGWQRANPTAFSFYPN